MINPTITETLEQARALEKELRQARERASDETWKFERISFDSGEFCYERNDDTGLIQIYENNYESQPIRAKFDSDFIAHAANQAIPLCDTLSRLIRVVEALTDGHEKVLASYGAGAPERPSPRKASKQALDQARAILGGKE